MWGAQASASDIDLCLHVWGTQESWFVFKHIDLCSYTWRGLESAPDSALDVYGPVYHGDGTGAGSPQNQPLPSLQCASVASCTYPGFWGWTHIPAGGQLLGNCPRFCKSPAFLLFWSFLAGAICSAVVLVSCALLPLALSLPRLWRCLLRRKG